jgi:predicted nucleotidyltransferase/lambda repressor-like predicted transcriptional regulator
MSASIATMTLARIAGAARAQGLSQRALALRAGVRPETVSRIASRGTCDFSTLERLAAAAGLRLGLQEEAAPAAGQARGEVLRKQALIRTLARAHGATSVELFGSAARGEDGAESDLDFLVELEPGRSLLDLIGLAGDLQEALGRKVEAVTAAGMKPRVLKEARRDAVRIV